MARQMRARPIRDPTGHHFNKVWQHVLKGDMALGQKKDNMFEAFSTKKGTQVSMEYSIEVAQRIMRRIDFTSSGTLTLEDFLEFFDDPEAAQKAFAVFDVAKTGEVTLDVIVEVVKGVHQERKALYNTLNDRDNIARVLKTFISIIFFLIMFIVILFIFEVDFQRFLLPLSTVFLGLSFVFGNSLKNVWEGLVEIFIVRPFDIGDRITFRDFPTLIINRIYMFSTEAFAPDGRKFIIPNVILFNSIVTQYKRSNDYAVFVTAEIDWLTPKEKIDQVQQLLGMWMQQDSGPWKAATPQDWAFWIDSVENCNRMAMCVWVGLAGVKWQTPGIFLKHKSNLWFALQAIFKDLNISYSLPDRRVFYVHERPPLPAYSSSFSTPLSASTVFSGTTSLPPASFQ